MTHDEWIDDLLDDNPLNGLRMPRELPFELGTLVIMPEARELAFGDIAWAVKRHSHGVWGRITPECCELNDSELRGDGLLRSVVSVHITRGKVHIFITTQFDFD